jgi:hypothetical protein
MRNLTMLWSQFVCFFVVMCFMSTALIGLGVLFVQISQSVVLSAEELSTHHHLSHHHPLVLLIEEII